MGSSRQPREVTETGDVYIEYPRFEIYSITINETGADDEDFAIKMCSSNGLEETLYRKWKDTDPPIQTGKPLRLFGPRRPPVSLDPIWIVFGPSDWGWIFNSDDHGWPPVAKGVKSQIVRDDSGTRSAVVVYEDILDTVLARIEITLASTSRGDPDLDEYKIGGAITASIDGVSKTTRNLLRSDHCQIPVKLGTPLRLDRSEIAIPAKSKSLNLHFNFTLAFDDISEPIMLEVDDEDFDVPERATVVSCEQNIMMRRKQLCGEDFSLKRKQLRRYGHIIDDLLIKVKVIWSSDFHRYSYLVVGSD